MLNKCCKPGCMCPFSFGLALGVTSALAMMIWSIWAMYYGMTPMMEAYHMPMPTWSSACLHAGMVFIKGFIFGFFLMLFYNFFACCVKSMCGKKCDTTCGCGTSTNKPEMK